MDWLQLVIVPDERTVLIDALLAHYHNQTKILSELVGWLYTNKVSNDIATTRVMLERLGAAHRIGG